MSPEPIFEARHAGADLKTEFLRMGLKCEPRRDARKTGIPVFGPGATQIGLYSHRRWLEA